MPALRAWIVVWGITLALPATQGAPALAPQAEDDPFSFLQPVVTVSPEDRRLVDSGEVVARTLPAGDEEVAVFAVSRLDTDADALVQWTRAIEALKSGPYVKAIRRFSNPPVLSDLDGLLLDDVDLEAIRRCRPGDCGVKLGAEEIQSLRVAASTAGAEWQSAVQREFRRIVFARVTRYHAEGLAALPAYVDHSEPTLPGDVFAGILLASPHLQRHVPAIADGLRRYPRTNLPATESFLYWSKENYGRGKSVIAVTQVHIVRPGGPPLPVVLVLGQEVYASHYRTGSLGMSAVVAGAGNERYLVYLNRTRLDTFRGILGGLKRSILKGRLVNEVKPAITTTRQRLESPAPVS